MAQKPLKKQGKAVVQRPKAAASKHGKSGAVSKKGRLQVAPKRSATKQRYSESRQLTKAINAENEEHFAGLAAKSGGRLSVLQAPVTATAEDKKAGKAAVRPAKGPGKQWGASSK